MKGLSKRKAASAAAGIVVIAAAAIFAVTHISASPKPQNGSSASVSEKTSVSENSGDGTSDTESISEEQSDSAELTIDFSIVYKDEYYSQLSEGLKADGILPESGYFADSAAVSVREDDTVLDALLSYCSENSIDVDYETAEQNAYGSAYVKGIGGLYAGDCTAMSGWGYSVDGVSPEVGMGDYELNGGETITIEYIIFE